MVEKAPSQRSMAFSWLRTKHSYHTQLYLTGAELESKVLTEFFKNRVEKYLSKIYAYPR